MQACKARGVNAIGLTGADMNVIRSVKRPVKEVDYGYVGDVEKVNADFLATLIRQGIVPVMAPLTHDGQGSMLNTNADTLPAFLWVLPLVHGRDSGSLMYEFLHLLLLWQVCLLSVDFPT